MQSIPNTNAALLNPAGNSIELTLIQVECPLFHHRLLGCRKPFTAGLTSKALRSNARHLRCQACHLDSVPISRRAVLLATAAVGGEQSSLFHRSQWQSVCPTSSNENIYACNPGSGLVVAAADAAAANFDNYKTAPSGLKWLDTQEGSGPPPVKGANIR